MAGIQPKTVTVFNSRTFVGSTLHVSLDVNSSLMLLGRPH